MSNKTITIQQGTGDDALEMTVQVTQEELDKMEKIRSIDPSAWEGRGLDLVKAAKDAIIEASEEKAQPQKCTNWKLILGITLGVLVIIGTIIFTEKSRNREQEVSQKQEINNAGAIEQWIGSECVEVNRRRIYETLKEKNKSAVPESFNVFSKAMDNQSYRDWAYEEVLQQKLKIGTKEEFELAMTQPNSDIFRCIFEIANYYGMPDSEEDMVSYLKESEENRKKFYYKLLEVGMPDGFDEFNNLIVNLQNNQQKQPNEYLHNLWRLSSQNGYKRDEKYLKEELIKSVEYRKLFYDKLKAEEPDFVENYSDFEKHWLYDVLSEPIYGLNLGTPKEFDSLVTNNEESRRWLWEKANECGLDVGKDFDEFWLLIAPESYYGKLYLDAKARGIKWDEKQFHELLSGDNIAWLYNILKQENLLIEGSEADFRAWLEIKSNRVYLYNELKNRNSISHNSIKEFDEWLGYTSIPEKTDNDLKKYTSLTYNFTIQYDDKEFQLVEKQNKNSHCVMKLQSPNDEVKSILVSVWENPEFSSSYDTDFVSSCQSVDEAMGKVISSTVKIKVDGVNALKSELIISPMGKSYYAAIYRIIHKKRMYMLNIYIPIEEYNKDKSYGDKCANNFKFN
jgi:hypothetical protein